MPTLPELCKKVLQEGGVGVRGRAEEASEKGEKRGVGGGRGGRQAGAEGGPELWQTGFEN